VANQPFWCDEQLIDLHARILEFSEKTEEVLTNQKTKDGLPS
jgi:hypothetical protein